MNNTLIVTGRGSKIGDKILDLVTSGNYVDRISLSMQASIFGVKYAVRIHNVNPQDLSHIKGTVGDQAKYQLI